MFGVLKSLLKVGATVVKLFTGQDRVSLMDGLPQVLGQLLPAVDNAIKYKGLDTKEKFDGWLETVDEVTGTDSLAIDVMPSLPADKEEELFDHLKEAARIYGYNKIGVDGYEV